MLGLPSRASRLIALDEPRIVLALVTADLDQNRRLEVEAALVIVLDAIAVLLHLLKDGYDVSPHITPRPAAVDQRAGGGHNGPAMTHCSRRG